MCKALGKDGNETQEPVEKNHEPVIIQEKGLSTEADTSPFLGQGRSQGLALENIALDSRIFQMISSY